MIARLVVGVVLAGALAACDSPKTPLQSDDIGIVARDTASIAREGSFLVAQLERGYVSSNYARVHGQALQDEARKAGEVLHKKPVPAELLERQQRVASLNDKLAAGLLQVGAAANDAGQLRRLARSFDDVGTQAEALKGAK